VLQGYEKLESLADMESLLLLKLVVRLYCLNLHE